MIMNQPRVLPSLDEIEEEDKKRQEELESLEISADGNFVKCKKCGINLPMRKLDRPYNTSRIIVLEHRIRACEEYQNKIKNNNNNNNSKNKNNNNDSATCKQLKQELVDLLKIEKERDTIRKLPLYSSRITDWKWYCSKCYDEACIFAARNKNK
jgi:RNA polymerase-binding transcription factor DksA